MSKEVGVSLNPENFVEGGGLLNDVDVIFKENSFTLYDYEGKSPVATPCLKSLLEFGTEGETVAQYWSMGKPEDWQPSKDGKKLIPVGSATGIVKTSRGGIFFTSLIDAGFPADRLADGDISCINGLEAHVIGTPPPERKGLERTKKENDILIIDNIIALPGEKKKGSGRGTSAGKSKAGTGKAGTATPATDNAAEMAAEKAISALLIMAPEEGIDRADLITDVFKKVNGDTKDGKLAKAAAQLAYSDDFLNADGRPWVFEDGVVKAAE